MQNWPHSHGDMLCIEAKQPLSSFWVGRKLMLYNKQMYSSTKCNVFIIYLPAVDIGPLTVIDCILSSLVQTVKYLY